MKQVKKSVRNASLHTTPAIAYVKDLKLWVVVNDEAQPIMYTKIKEEAKSLLECIERLEGNSDLRIPTIDPRHSKYMYGENGARDMSVRRTAVATNRFTQSRSSSRRS